MGRVADLFGEVAAAADEGPDGLVLSAEELERLRGEWSDEDIDDALALVQDSLLHSELVDAADSLSTRLVEVLGSLAEPAAFARCAAGDDSLAVDVLGQLTRRVTRLEEVLEVFRETAPPDRAGFDALVKRLADLGIEHEMASGAGNGEADED
jgi:uncharacterized protein with von Willebrand factor type A (vWA) domain